jgi:hypothetical protein
MCFTPEKMWDVAQVVVDRARTRDAEMARMQHEEAVQALTPEQRSEYETEKARLEAMIIRRRLEEEKVGASGGFAVGGSSSVTVAATLDGDMRSSLEGGDTHLTEQGAETSLELHVGTAPATLAELLPVPSSAPMPKLPVVLPSAPSPSALLPSEPSPTSLPSSSPLSTP